ncbi:homoserine kinase [Flavobacterium columnare]|nr:homoserine kinase [Flavobacterium columnare]
MEKIHILSPATIANLSCGFDVLGACTNIICEEMIIHKVTTKGIKITHITGAILPLETEKNVAGMAAQSIYNLYKEQVDFGFEIEIHKKVEIGSGIGSSAASAAAAVFGINYFLGNPLSKKELVYHAMIGEAIASGSQHADNVAAAILGNFTLIRSYNPLDIIEIPSPKELYTVILHPHVEVKTSEARAVLKPTVPLKNAIIQWGNLGGLIAGLYTNNYQLIGNSLTDVIIEPYRKELIPYFEETVSIARQTGALGAGISGSGPSIFALAKGEINAQKIAEEMKNYYQKTGISFTVYFSKINNEGVKLKTTKENAIL